MKVKEVADLVGISVRTLHHYDEIGLLVPEGATEAGYRIYSGKNLDLLQQILFFRELGFPLQTIKNIIHSPGFDRLAALQQHRLMLRDKRNRLNRLLETVDKSIQFAKGESDMTNKEQFSGFDFSQNPYEKEARERWGNAAVDSSAAKVKGMQQSGEMAGFQEEMNELYRELTHMRHNDPASPEAQEGIGKWYAMLNRVGSYTPEMFKGLGEMYVADERFTKNIDGFGEGLAAFMRDAMAEFADRQLK
ncbi:MerR family transcriptional regulator [Paenibacillus sp. CAU 1782]